jgi:prolyl-tRNA synthetase
MYRAFAEEDAAIPVVVGEKPANERFPGAEATFSIEAMMQDGKALQAGTSHYLGTSFAEAANIRYQDREGGQQLCHTTSWGVSTRMVGAMIMVHGDDDGLRVPPTLAPYQVVILPMLREDDSDAALLAYCEELRGKLLVQLAFGEPLRVLLDARPGKAAGKRWDWVRRGAPLIVEVGPRDMEGGKAAVLRRDRLWNDAAKPNFAFTPRDEFAAAAPALLEEIQRALFDQAAERREANLVRDIDSLDALKAFFGEDKRFPGWAEVQWARPEGAALDKVVEQLKALKLTFRNVPANAAPADGTCLFTGKPAVERILVARAY